MTGFDRRHKALIRKATVACKNLNSNLSVKESNITGDFFIMNDDSILLTFTHMPNSKSDLLLAYAGASSTYRKGNDPMNDSKKNFFIGCPIGKSTGYYEWNEVRSIQLEDVEALIRWSWNKIQNK